MTLLPSLRCDGGRKVRADGLTCCIAPLCILTDTQLGSASIPPTITPSWPTYSSPAPPPFPNRTSIPASSPSCKWNSRFENLIETAFVSAFASPFRSKISPSASNRTITRSRQPGATSSKRAVRPFNSAFPRKPLITTFRPCSIPSGRIHLTLVSSSAPLTSSIAPLSRRTRTSLFPLSLSRADFPLTEFQTSSTRPMAPSSSASSPVSSQDITPLGTFGLRITLHVRSRGF
mmetsp:Transcript_14977/g.35303  ORF Transcript_14977/g.35303 Transcript_14977/m.35303 type:complete len:232 (+) Transcript_14977:533-1228(+)